MDDFVFVWAYSTTNCRRKLIASGSSLYAVCLTERCCYYFLLGYLCVPAAKWVCCFLDNFNSDFVQWLVDVCSHQLTINDSRGTASLKMLWFQPILYFLYQKASNKALPVLRRKSSHKKSYPVPDWIHQRNYFSVISALR